MRLKYQTLFYTLFFILVTSFFTLANDKDYQLITMEFAPYNYTESGKLVGICTEIFKEILNRINHPKDIKSFPLIRAYRMLEKDDDIIIYSRLRTPERETRNKWVGPLAPFRVVLYARKNSNIELTDINDAKKYNVGCSRGSFGHRLLIKNDFRHIYHLTKGSSNSRKLRDGRIDLWITSALSGKYGAKINFVNSDLFEIVYEFQPTYSLYIAFSNNISDEIVEEWQRIFDQLKYEGIYDTIFDSYLN